MLELARLITELLQSSDAGSVKSFDMAESSDEIVSGSSGFNEMEESILNYLQVRITDSFADVVRKMP
jgi:hypothetical protein